MQNPDISQAHALPHPTPTNPRTLKCAHSGATPSPLRPRPGACWLGRTRGRPTWPSPRSPLTRSPTLLEASVQLSLPWCFWFHLLPRALNKAFLPKSFFESILSLIIFVFLSIRYHKIGISSFLPCEIKMKLSNRPRSGNSSSSKCGRWCRNMRITREPVGISGSEIISWFLTAVSEKDLATHSSALVWRILWAEEPGGLLSMGLYRVGHDWSNLACMHALEKELATHSSVLAWRIPWTEEPGGLPSMGSHRVRHDWSNLAAAATAVWWTFETNNSLLNWRKQRKTTSFQGRKPIWACLLCFKSLFWSVRIPGKRESS